MTGLMAARKWHKRLSEQLSSHLSWSVLMTGLMTVRKWRKRFSEQAKFCFSRQLSRQLSSHLNVATHMRRASARVAIISQVLGDKVFLKWFVLL